MMEVSKVDTCISISDSFYGMEDFDFDNLVILKYDMSYNELVKFQRLVEVFIHSKGIVQSLWM